MQLTAVAIPTAHQLVGLYNPVRSLFRPEQTVKVDVGAHVITELKQVDRGSAVVLGE